MSGKVFQKKETFIFRDIFINGLKIALGSTGMKILESSAIVENKGWN